MRIYDAQEIAPWAASHGLDLASVEGGFGDAADPVVYAVPPDSGAKTALARRISWLFPGEAVLLLVTQIDIWESCQNHFLFQVLRRDAGEHRQIYDAPYHVFEPDDRDYLEAFLAVCSYFVWEFLVVSETGDLVLQFDHHEELRVWGSSGERIQAAHELFRAFGLEEK